MAARAVPTVERSLLSATWRVGTALGGLLAVKKILLGQVWKKDDTTDTYLVTKLYNEVFSTFAVLRKVGGEDILRVKVEKQGDSALLRGFTYTQDSQDF